MQRSRLTSRNLVRRGGGSAAASRASLGVQAQMARRMADTEYLSSVLQVYEGPDHVKVVPSPELMDVEVVGYEMVTSVTQKERTAGQLVNALFLFVWRVQGDIMRPPPPPPTTHHPHYPTTCPRQDVRNTGHGSP